MHVIWRLWIKIFIVNWMVVQYVWKWCWRGWNSFNCSSCYSSRKSWKWCLWLLRNTAYRVLLLNLLLMLKGSKMSNTMYCTLYTGPVTPPRGKAIYLKAFRLVGLAVDHQSVWGGSFVNILGLVKLQEWLQARCTANPQFLKLRGHSATW